MSREMYISLNGQVNGDLLVQNDSVLLGGNFTGEIRATKIVVQEKCRFDGKLVADSIVIMGHVSGECESESLHAMEASITEANIFANDVRIEVGAKIAGAVRSFKRSESDKVVTKLGLV
jgi:cytoskeletal protein CcmA (bactofilin family)